MSENNNENGTSALQRNGPLYAVVATALAAALFVVGVAALQSSETVAATESAPVSPDYLPAHIDAYAPAPAADDEAAEGIDFEPFERFDPDLPEPPEGDVKRFRMDVYEHVTKVADDLAPTRVWSYGVNGEIHRGNGGSTPMVVTEGDQVEVELVNGGSEEMDVKFPHSVDFHSSKVAPNEQFVTIAPGETTRLSFVAEHPGVFLYHCATDPVLWHTGAGMVGTMVVKPKDLEPADRDLMITQQEFYIGEPGEDADLAKMEAKNPSAITFNGYAGQYAEHPIVVKKGENIRMWVLNAGPSIWSSFHVIGTIFDRTKVEGVEGRSSQTLNLAPSEGGYVEFTLDEEGAYPFVTHAFGDMVKGAVGVLATEGYEPEGDEAHDH